MSCEDCYKGFTLPGEPSGSMVDGAYLTYPAFPAPDGQPKRAIVVLTDIFGLPLKNSRVQADKIAKELNVDVWVPDLFAGMLSLQSYMYLWTHVALGQVNRR